MHACSSSPRRSFVGFYASCPLPCWRTSASHVRCSSSELALVHCRGRVQHEILGPLGLGKRDDVANILGIGQQHHEAVDPRGNPSMGRRPIVEGFEQMAEAAFDLRGLVAEHLKEALLDRAVVDTNRAGRQLVPVTHEVVGRSADLPRNDLELRQILRIDHTERVVFGLPASLVEHSSRTSGNRRSRQKPAGRGRPA